MDPEMIDEIARMHQFPPADLADEQLWPEYDAYVDLALQLDRMADDYHSQALAYMACAGRVNEEIQKRLVKR